MSLSIGLVKDANTYYPCLGGEYTIPFGNTYTVDVSFHGDFANDDERYRIGLKIDGISVGYVKTVKNATQTVGGARRVSFNGTTMNSCGTERAAFVVVDPSDAAENANDMCGTISAWAQRGRWVECARDDDKKFDEPSAKKARIAGGKPKVTTTIGHESSSSSSGGSPAATGHGERFATNGFPPRERLFRVDDDAPVIFKHITYSGV